MVEAVEDNTKRSKVSKISPPCYQALKEESEQAEQSCSHASCTIKHQLSILSSEVDIRVYALISPRGNLRC